MKEATSLEGSNQVLKVVLQKNLKKNAEETLLLSTIIFNCERRINKSKDLSKYFLEVSSKGKII